MSASHTDWRSNAHQEIWSLTRLIGEEWYPSMSNALNTLYEWSETMETIVPPYLAHDWWEELK